MTSASSSSSQSATSQSSGSSPSSPSYSSTSGEEFGNQLLPGLEAFWEMAELESGPSLSHVYGRHLTENTAPVPVEDGVRTKARRFNGPLNKDNYLRRASEPAFTFGSGAFTVTGWINVSAETQDGVLVAKSEGVLGGLSWFLEYNYAGQFLALLSSDGLNWTTALAVDIPGGIDVGSWYFVYLKREGSTFTVGYRRQGETSFTENTASSAAALYDNAAVPVTIGNWRDQAGVTSEVNALDGSVCDVGIWKGVALSPCSLGKLFNDGDALDPDEFDSFPCG
jgi:hypothetical protein